MWSYLPIAPQCCDAFTYVVQGASCATEGVCAGGIRPIGDYYWFSIPVRFGLPLNSLILLNILLMLLSVWLSTRSFKQLLSSNVHQAPPGMLATTALCLASLLIHSIFLYPTLFHTLADPPAGCLLLSGIWLLLLSGSSTPAGNKALLLAAGGLCWGLAAWLRALFLYPVLCGLSAYLLLFIFNRKRAWRDLLILLALLPIGFQYLYSYVHTGKFSYIDDQSSSFTTMHTSLTVAGYDTTFPSDGYFWYPKCVAGYGIIEGLKAQEFSQVACLVRSRLYFYLGTYVPETYIFTNVINQLASAYIVRTGDTVEWWLDRFDIQTDVVPAPDGSPTGDKLIQLPSPQGGGKVFKPLALRGNTAHTFSVWLWSPLPITVDLAIVRNFDNISIATRHIRLTPLPQRYSVTGRTANNQLVLPPGSEMVTAQYSATIGLVPDQPPVSLDGAASEVFLYVWGGQLEVSDHMSEYHPHEYPVADDVRIWRPSLLALNIFMVLMGALFIIIQRKIWLQSRAGLVSLITIAVIAAECVVIIPEQRFAATPMIFIWLIATASLFYCFNLLLRKIYV